MADSSLADTRAQPAPASPLSPALAAIYETVYATDLVYVKDCWKLCGDAHCCSFQRYKSRYRILAQHPFQELPLLPGEWAWLQRSGWAAQFEPCEFRVQATPVAGRLVQHESVISRRTGGCACDHATRPTICRLYPLLPRFDLQGQLVGVERTGLYEEMERIGGLPSACRLEQLPFDQLPAFLALTAALASSPLLRWHLEAYRLTKAHVAQRLQARVQAGTGDVFQAFEAGFLRRALIDKPALHAELAALMTDFDRAWPGWDEGMARPAAPQAEDAR
ncbi:MAG: hypothetical protein JNJ71_12010 [Rubrivivax sp.]|nr:hypothetical protein [Rubrivivax sp.]